jgi:hypothetical protein
MVLAPARTFVLKLSIRMVAGFLGITERLLQLTTTHLPSLDSAVAAQEFLSRAKLVLGYPVIVAGDGTGADQMVLFAYASSRHPLAS